jgi:hypothetical protein
MTFTPKFASKFGGPIRDNIKALLEAREADAILAMNGVSLPASKEFRRSIYFNTLSPVTSVVLIETDPAQSEDDSRIDERHEINVVVDIQGPDPDSQVLEAEARIRAYDAILRTATAEEILANMGYRHTCEGFFLEIGTHNYSYFYSEPRSLYRTTVFFVVTVSLFEGLYQSN